MRVFFSLSRLEKDGNLFLGINFCFRD